jgi:hypothetical protein
MSSAAHVGFELRHGTWVKYRSCGGGGGVICTTSATPRGSRCLVKPLVYMWCVVQGYAYPNRRAANGTVPSIQLRDLSKRMNS